MSHNPFPPAFPPESRHAVADYAHAIAADLRELANLIDGGVSPSDLGPRIERLGRIAGHRT